jgi:hypothetical protein
MNRTKSSKSSSLSTVVSWVDGATSSMMDPAAAQVTPSEITHKLVNKAVEQGYAKVVIGTVIDVKFSEIKANDGNRSVVAVHCEDGTRIEWVHPTLPIYQAHALYNLCSPVFHILQKFTLISAFFYYCCFCQNLLQMFSCGVCNGTMDMSSRELV